MSRGTANRESRIAIVGVSCRYPDADSPKQLWENVLAGRRAFRELPPERMNLGDYWSPDPAAPDRFYSRYASVIEGFEFDRVEHRVAGSTFRSTDMTHWLALDTVARALADAGFARGEGLPTQTTGVILGNTLTGEFSRANLMRLRWPYVRRTVGAALLDDGWDPDRAARFLDQLEVRYKAPYPEIDEDTLAGGLANTIAGRICNHFDFKGGGYTVDGACSSSLLAVSAACDALALGRSDAMIAGGVDLSIDPFEIIGFAKTGALSKTEMKVYDRDSDGFWPGEGCGVVVLMREADAVAQKLPVYANIAGWGSSSDGKGGITRPEASGHRLAITRAYARAGYQIDSVGYLEGHGTGTAVGDATELRAFTEAIHEADPDRRGVVISTVKGNIGHTKAAAGVAGLLKATLAVHHQVIPPATGHFTPHPQLMAADAPLVVTDRPRTWPADAPIRAGISSMGFGGINAHIVLEHPGGERRAELDEQTVRAGSSRQDAEVLLMDAATLADLRGRVAQVAAIAPKLAYAELGDLAGQLAGELAGAAVRAAVVADSPAAAAERLDKLSVLLDSGVRAVVDVRNGIFVGTGTRAPRIGFLFPGQGSGTGMAGAALRRRYPAVDPHYARLRPLAGQDAVDTAVAQPRIVTGSLAALQVLGELGIEADGALGHSLGELTALHWAGAMAPEALFELAAARGRIMARASEGGGTMAGLNAGPDTVSALLNGGPAVIAGYNGPDQTVVSGSVDAVEKVCAAAAAQGIGTTRLKVSHAFHSPLVAPAAEAFGAHLAGQDFQVLERTVVSTVTGRALSGDTDLRALLQTQILEPVRFSEALATLAADCELLVEVGPGRVLSHLAGRVAPDVPVTTVDTDAPGLGSLLATVAAAFTLGAPLKADRLFADRLLRPLPLDKEFRFFASPCESAPAVDLAMPAGERLALAFSPKPSGQAATASAPDQAAPGGSALDVLRALAAERAELPLEAVRPESMPLDDLHLSSITVGQIVNQAARQLELIAPAVTANVATATIADLAEMLEDLSATALPGDAARDTADGVAPWVRAFGVDWIPDSRPPARAAEHAGSWQVFAPAGHQLADALASALTEARLGAGVLLCLPHEGGERYTSLMLQAARAAVSAGGPVRFAVVQDRLGAAGLAKTLHLENPAIATTVVSLPLARALSPADVDAAVRDIVADVAATEDFSELRYDVDGTRSRPVLRAFTAPPADPGARPEAGPPLAKGDVVLVTGGAKGITAECAIALAQRTGTALGLVGRSDPAADPELAANLARFDAAEVVYEYVRADVTRADEAKAAVQEVRRRLGPVTAILHGAGRNEPTALTALDESLFRRTLAPKTAGLEAVLAAADPDHLKLLVTFGSIIGRAGLRGEAHYATANDWLTELTGQAAVDLPGCRCLALEWSVWSGAGMGEKLGVVESLVRDGIVPIPVEDGVRILMELLAEPATPGAVVVMGRAEGLPTIRFEEPDLPLSRFVDHTLVHYPGVELVAEIDLAERSDLYLADHELDGDLLFPAVFGMEAMTQAGAALTGRDDPPVLRNVEFLRPIVVPPAGSARVRLAVLRKDADTVQAVIRTADTGFQADHFRADLVYGRQGSDHPAAGDALLADVDVDVDTASGPALSLAPHPELYGPVLFQGGRFQRVRRYRWLASTSCVVDIGLDPATRWFESVLPAGLRLGDPGARDAFMHAIQCCVPDATLLPASVERIEVAPPGSWDGEEVVLEALERVHDGNTYIYDLDVRDGSGAVVERWRGLRLQAVRQLDGSGPWAPALLGPHLERKLEALGASVPRCVVLADGPDVAGDTRARRGSTTEAARLLLGRRVEVAHRPDGKPEIAGGPCLSASHTPGLTFAVSADKTVACDVESVAGRDDQQWQDLLGADSWALARLVAGEAGEPLDQAATRVWGALECLSKAGLVPARALVLDTVAGPGLVAFRCGSAVVAGFTTRVAGHDGQVCFSILSEGRKAL